MKGQIRFTPEEKAFLASFIPGHTAREVSVEFSRRFRPLAEGQVKNYKAAHGIRSGTFRGRKKGTVPLLFPVEIQDWLRANNEGKPLADATAALNARFGTAYSTAQVKGLRSRLHLDSGLNGRFVPGNVPYNKGKKGSCPAGCEKGWFRKGQRPHNQAEVGAEVMATVGYVKVKVGEPDVWRFKHVMNWEKEHGPVPRGMVLLFKDGDHRNCEAGNLVLCTRRELATLNHMGLGGEAEVRAAAIALAKLKVKVSSVLDGKEE